MLHRILARLRSFWSRSLLSKLLLLAGGSMFLCCCSATLIALVSPGQTPIADLPSRAPAVQLATVEPTKPAAIKATAIPAATNTTAPAAPTATTKPAEPTKPAPTNTSLPALATATSQPPTATTKPAATNTPAPVDKIEVSASVSNAKPSQKSNVTVTGKITKNGAPLADVPMVARWHYKSSDPTCDGVSNAQGVASCTRDIGQATKDYKVTIDVVFTYQGKTYTASTSFTPQ